MGITHICKYDKMAKFQDLLEKNKLWFKKNPKECLDEICKQTDTMATLLTGDIIMVADPRLLADELIWGGQKFKLE